MSRSRKTLFLVSLFLVAVSQLSRSTGLSTTNRDALDPFWRRVENGAGPVTIMSFGDSMADNFRSIGRVLLQNFAGRLGAAGYILNDPDNNGLPSMSNGATYSGQDQWWYENHYFLPPGGELEFDRVQPAAGLLADTIGLFYMSQSNGGAFTMSISTNGGS